MSEEERRALKEGLLIDTLMSLGVHGGPAQVIRDALTEAVGGIASYDFPTASWPTLIPQCLERLAGVVIDGNNAAHTATVFRLFHRVFKRYRSAFRSDELYTEINLVLSQLAPSLLDYYQRLHIKPLEGGVLSALTAMNKVFYDLSAQDLPAYFEDHLEQFMSFFSKHMSLPTQRIGSDDEYSAVDRVKVSVVKIVTLYAQRYEEDFPQLTGFIQNIWQQISEARSDNLMSAMLRLVATVAKQERHRQLFESEDLLNSLVVQLILPNLSISEEDLELFEDEPQEFLRRDAISGEGRSGAATELIRALLALHQERLTSIAQYYIAAYLQSYTAAPVDKWRLKLVAMQLFTAIAVIGSVESHGATKVNSLVNIDAMLTGHVIPDLQPTNAALHPMLKVAAIRWVQSFRMHLDKDKLVSVFALLLHHLGSHSVVIHSYAAMTIERILAIKRNAQPMFAPDDLSDLAGPLIETIQQMLVKKGGSVIENEHLMRALNRVVLASGPSTSYNLQCLSWILDAIARNPSNPQFTHFLFESIAAMLRFGAQPDPLLPVLQRMSADESNELQGYSYQLFAAMVRFGDAPFTPALLAGILSPEHWSRHEVVPAMLSFVLACLLKFDLTDSFTGLFGVFQLLLSSRLHEPLAFTLFSAILQTQPFNVAFYKPALTVILNKLQAVKGNALSSARIAVNMTILLSAFLIVHGGRVVSELFDSVQPGLLGALVKSVIAVHFGKISVLSDKRLAIVGMARLLEVLEPDSASILLNSLIQGILHAKPEPAFVQSEEATEEEEQTAKFAQLMSIPRLGRLLKLPLVSLPEPLAAVLEACRKQPHLLPSLPAEQRAWLRSVGL